MSSFDSINKLKLEETMTIYGALGIMYHNFTFLTKSKRYLLLIIEYKYGLYPQFVLIFKNTDYVFCVCV